MIKASFIMEADTVCGFEIRGHSGFSEEGTDIVCAAVSSAAYMTANTVTEVLHLEADIQVSQAKLSLKLKKDVAPKAQDVLKGFLLHLKGLEEQYPQNITLIFTEV
ncbi:MAG: ribosomal-processing cysteine protease Prp [Eubacteriales bacterium]|nr:ribosomal-processing cysteine protease Prp [Eubacteriales bacterium]